MLEDLVGEYVRVENQVMLAWGFGWAMGVISGLLAAYNGLRLLQKDHDDAAH